MIPGVGLDSRQKQPGHWYEALRTFWPIIAMFATALVGYGALRADVAELKEGRAAAKQDHDAIVRIETQQRTMATDVERIKSDVAAIRDAVRPR